MLCSTTLKVFISSVLVFLSLSLEDVGIFEWGKKMIDHDILFVPHQSMQECYKACRKRPKCLSFNYNPTAKTCTLNDQSKDQDPGSVQIGLGLVFSDRLNWEKDNPNPCGSHETYNEEDTNQACTVEECGGPETIGESSFHGNKNSVGSRIRYKCYIGETLTKSYISTCQNNGSWSKDNFFTCETPVYLTQWASRVVSFSTQYNSDSWSAEQVLGEPNVYPNYGDLEGTWAPKDKTDSEFLELEYDHAVYLEEIHIYETFHAGGVKAVKALKPDGIWETVWGPYPVQDITSSRINSITIQTTTFQTNTIRLDVDCTANGENWVEIDAVHTVGVAP